MTTASPPASTSRPSIIDPNRNRRVDVRLKQALEAGAMPLDTLIEGPAGTGKTRGILSVFHTLARDYPGLRILICRQTRASMTESVLATFEEEVLKEDGCDAICRGERRDHRSNYRYPNTSRVVLCGLDKPDRALSTAWDLIFVNEAIEATEASYDGLRSRLARPGRDRRFGFMLADVNPGDPSHWLNQRCIAGRTARWQTGHAANPGLFDENGWTPHWPRYRDNLKSLPGTRRKRFYEGVWAAGEGAWFGAFDSTDPKHVNASAEYDPRYPVHLAVDTGKQTGAVLWQVRDEADGPSITVFGDYHTDNVPAADNGRALLGLCGELCRGRYDVGRYDPAGGARVGFGGMTIAAEFARVGLNLQPWIKYQGCVLAGLNLVESFLFAGKLRVHPRCTHLIAAFGNYMRLKRGANYVDEPAPDQHPHGELIDALRSSLLDRFPEGRRPEPPFRRVHGGRVF